MGPDRRVWRSDVPDGVSGGWIVDRWDVTDGSYDGEDGPIVASVPDGFWRRLRCGRDAWMTDAPLEWVQHWAALGATGRILANGLGLGVIVDWWLQDPAVEHVDVVELELDVIDLVAAHLVARWGDRLTVHHGDAWTFDWPPGTRFDFAWHDIWRTCGADDGRAALMARHATVAAAQACWPTQTFLCRPQA